MAVALRHNLLCCLNRREYAGFDLFNHGFDQGERDHTVPAHGSHIGNAAVLGNLLFNIAPYAERGIDRVWFKACLVAALMDIFK